LIALAAAAASKSVSAWDQPGTLGFLVVFGLGIILFFVFRSLARHLRKINEAARLEMQAKPAESGPAGSDSGEPRNDFVRTEYERQQSEQNAVDLDF
jgi:hypothetical protein